MPKVILMRHAKSDWDIDHFDDHERPLNERGIKSANVLGQWLQDNMYTPRHILCSSATRAQQTAHALGLCAPVTTDPTLYLARAQTLWRVAKNAGGQHQQGPYLLIAHNPGIASLVCAICDQSTLACPTHHAFRTYPTGATTVIDIDDFDQNNARIVDFIVPKDLL